MAKPSNVIRKVADTAEDQRGYFMVIATEAKKLCEIANSRINPRKIGKEMYHHLRIIQRKENWEQMFSSVNKLKKRAVKLLKQRGIPENIRSQLTDALGKLKVYEAGVLKDTVTELARRIKREHGRFIVYDLPGIRKNAREIYEFATAAAYIDSQITRIFRPKG